MSFNRWFLFAPALGLALAPRAQAAANLLPNAVQKGNIQINLQPVASGLTAPVFGTSAPGNPNDLFVVDQVGKINVLRNGAMQSTPLLDLSAVESAIPLRPGYDERGLLGLAFSPGFSDPASPGYRTLYTYQSEAAGSKPADFAPAPGTVTGVIDHQNVLTEWKVSAANPLVVDPASRRDLIREDHPALNHNGGTIAFGPDGYLYLAIGDGGAANDSGNGHIVETGNAGINSVIMGKMIRIDPRGNNSSNHQYGIPADNPLVGAQGVLPEIYANGFRNPYKFSFDNATGRLIEADAGQNNVEEVNIVTAAHNYGWPAKEGTFLFNRTGPNAGTVDPTNSPGSPAGLIDPVLEYDHNAGTAVVGGFVYHGAKIPELVGKYVFGDFSNGAFSAPGNGRLFYADLETGQINEFILGNPDHPLGLWVKGFGQDASGELYVMASTNLGPSGSTGQVFAIVAIPEPASMGILGAGAALLLARRRATRRH